MGRKSKYSADFKLMIIHETETSGITRTSRKYVIMPFKYTDEKENSLYAWRAFSYGKKIEIFC